VWCLRLVWKLDLSILYVVHFCKFWSIILVIYSKIPLTRLPIIQIFWSSNTWGEQFQDQKFCFLPEGSLFGETGRSQEHVQKASKSACTSATVFYPGDFLLLYFFSSWDSKKHITGPEWPLASRQGIYPSGILLWLAVQPKCWSSNKKLLVRT